VLTRLLLRAHLAILGLSVVNLAYLRLTRRHRARPVQWPMVSVLVPARNEEASLPRLLASLLAQEYPGTFEVIIVDDASEDDTWKVLQRHADPRLRAIRSAGPAAGWIGKNHALYTAAGAAGGDVLLFLDADARLIDEHALARLVERHTALGAGAAMSGLPRYADRGPALWLTSLVPMAAMSTLPLPLVRATRTPTVSALNGQCWLVSTNVYRRLQPHAALRSAVLEDVEIGRLLKRAGVPLALRDLADEIEVEMYRSFGEAWHGFRKNAYLLQGGRPVPFWLLHAAYVMLYVVAPRRDVRLLATTFALKAISDRASRLPWRILPMTTLSLLAGGLLQLDSARAHWSRRVEWKGRAVVSGPGVA